MKGKDDAMGKWLVLVSLLRVLWIGYFRVPETLTFKTTISAKPFLWKWDYLHENKKPFFTSRASQTALLWNRDLNNWQKAYCARPIPCLEFLCNISSRIRSVSSPDETLRKELKIRRAAEYFWRTSRCFIWWWNDVSNAWYYFSNKMTLEGEIKDAKIAVFHLISKHSLNINFLCISFMNYQWVWEVCIIFSWFWIIQFLSSPQP